MTPSARDLGDDAVMTPAQHGGGARSAAPAHPGLDETLELLRAGGDHPLMRDFPRGTIFCFDRDLRFLAVGGRGLAETGLSRELLEGRAVAEAFPAETASVLERPCRVALAGEQAACDVPFHGRVYALRVAPVHGECGEVVAGIGAVEDVTEDRAREREHTEALARNELTFVHAPIGQALVGLDGNWLRVNQALLTLLEYDEPTLLALTFQDITHPEDLDLDLELLQKTLTGEITDYTMEKRYFTRTGRIVWVQLSVSLVRGADGEPLYFISQIQDITAHKTQMQALRDLTAMLAHDLRNPAAVIAGFAHLLATGPHDEEVVRSAQRIERAAGTLTDLLENALTTEAIDSGRLVATPRAVDVAAAVQDAARAVESAIPTKEPATAIDLGRVRPTIAWCDPVHLGQVLTNLLSNARKYGGPHVVVSSRTLPGTIEVTVADDGAGVPPAFVPQLFERYSRADQARTGRHRGSGLGLCIVRDLLEANGGTISYAPSATLGGAEFRVTLPLA